MACGRCLYSAATPLDKVVTSNETVHHPRQFQTAYIFPGIALGVSISGATRIRDEMFLAAADAVATQVPNCLFHLLSLLEKSSCVLSDGSRTFFPPRSITMVSITETQNVKERNVREAGHRRRA